MISIGLFGVSVGNVTWIELLEGLLDVPEVTVWPLMMTLACVTINYLFIGRFRFLPWR